MSDRFAAAIETAIVSGSILDLDATLAAAREAEAGGVELIDLLRLANQVAQEVVDRPSVSPAATLETLRHINAELVSAHLPNQGRSPRVPTAAQRLFAALAHDEPLSAEDEAQLREYGLPPACRTIFPVGITVSSASAATVSAIAADLRRRGALAVVEEPFVLMLLPATPSASLLPAAATTITCPAVPREELPLAIARLRRALHRAESLGLRGRVPFDELLVDLLLAENKTLAVELAARLSCLSAEGEDRLMTTLRTFLSCGGQRSAAAIALHVHPNTLDLRLKRIRELTGLDMRIPDDLVRLVLGLRAAEGLAA